MSNKSDRVKKWRETVKERMIDSFGGKCFICGYSKCSKALEFHHINPDEKEFNFGEIMARPKSWDKIVVELRKCVCLCSNCHREVHAGILILPKDIIQFDESFADFYLDKKLEHYNECPFCGKLKPKINNYCSHECSSFDRKKVDWDSIDIQQLRHGKKMSLTEIGELIGVSVSAVSKRMRKLGIRTEIEEPVFYDI